MPTGEILVTPSGMIYEDMVPEDVLVMDIEGNIIEGERKPSVDTVALLYILKHMPEVNAVIHTHQPYATGVGLVTEELPLDKLYMTTRFIDYSGGDKGNKGFRGNKALLKLEVE